MKKRFARPRTPLLMGLRLDLSRRTSWEIRHMDPSEDIAYDWLSVAIRDNEDRIHLYSIKVVDDDVVVSGPVPLTVDKDTDQLADLIHLHLMAHSRFI